jgi:hypothetical protein
MTNDEQKSSLETQIGGDHYTKLAIQPMQYSMENGLDPLQHTIIKYVTRFRDKAGIEDLEKAKHWWRLSENKRYASFTTTSRRMYGWKSFIPNRWKFTTTPSSRQKSNY